MAPPYCRPEIGFETRDPPDLSRARHMRPLMLTNGHQQSRETLIGNDNANEGKFNRLDIFDKASSLVHFGSVLGRMGHCGKVL